MNLYYVSIDLPTGPAFAAATKDGLCKLDLNPPSFGEFIEEMEAYFGMKPVEDGRLFQTLSRELKSYFAGEPVSFTQKLDLRGTDFQKTVWRELLKIPYGNVRSYKWLAAQAGNPNAARAVGNALNGNKIPVIVPCHRIIESSGGIGGFGGGIELKKRLLQLEGVLPACHPERSEESRRFRISLPA
ncbi:MAG: methylated-DNA--[protein]-cysteine S-methyltransferase [Nitrospirota bacterium]